MNTQPIIVNAELCRGCEECILACSLYHFGQCNPALARLYVTRETQRYAFIPRVCLQCDDPDCLSACPSEAIEIDEFGVSYIVAERCDGCGLCQDACPYNAIALHKESSLYLKCDLCRERDGGPICVEVCPTGALSLASKQGREG